MSFFSLDSFLILFFLAPPSLSSCVCLANCGREDIYFIGVLEFMLLEGFLIYMLDGHLRF